MRALASGFITRCVARAVLIEMAVSPDSFSAVTNPAHVAPKKNKSATTKPRTKPVHTRTSEMVGNAIKGLKDRGGSSLQVYCRELQSRLRKVVAFIKKYFKTAVTSGVLVQTKGKGACGSFKLAAVKTEKAAVPTAPARGRAASAPKAKKQSAAKLKKAKAPKKSSCEICREEARFASGT
jgi:histone H1/5